jgi:hypothetical protein
VVLGAVAHGWKGRSLWTKLAKVKAIEWDWTQLVDRAVQVQGKWVQIVEVSTRSHVSRLQAIFILEKNLVLDQWEQVLNLKVQVLVHVLLKVQVWRSMFGLKPENL